MQDATQGADEWITAADLAEEWNVSLKTLANQRWRGDGPKFSKLGPGRFAPVRYRRSDVDSFVRSRRADTLAEPR